MKYAIDVYFLNKQYQVIAVIKNLKPFRFSPMHFGARSVIEFAAGVDRDCAVGDHLSLQKDNLI